MQDWICVLGRHFEAGDLEKLREWIGQRQGWSRRRLSVELAQQWGWRNAKGDLRDMATRLLLSRLERQGLLQLPARQKRGGRRQVGSEVGLSLPAAEPITGPLDQVQPLSVQLMVAGQSERRRLVHYLQQYHYLGYPHPLGQLHYLVRDCCGRDVAGLLFGPAAWKCAGRDRFIGWTRTQRQSHLCRVANNSRLLILPWVKVPHLASHLLGLVLDRLAADWREHHGQAAVLAETFVEIGRFAGTCYRAANWIEVGCTQGRSRHGAPGVRVPLKQVYLRALVSDFRQILCR